MVQHGLFVGCAHQCLSDQYRVSADVPESVHVICVLYAALGDKQYVAGDQFPQPAAVLRIYAEVLEIAVVDADDACAGVQRNLNNNPISRTETIPPEAVISVPASRFIYFINRYSSLVTLTVSLSTLGISLYNIFGSK